MSQKSLIYITLSREEVIRNSIHWPILQRLEQDFEKIFVFCWGRKYDFVDSKYHFVSGNILTWLPTLWKLKNVSLIYANDYFIGGYLGTILKHWKKAPLFTRVGSPWVYEGKKIATKLKQKILIMTKKRVLRKSEMIVYNSNSIVEKNMNHNFKVIYNGVDLTLFKPVSREYFKENFPKFSKEDRRRLLYIGNINIEKGIQYLLEAVISLTERVSLTIVGDGPLLEEYKKKYPKINFIGRVAKNKIPEIINEHDVFILPTFVESFPNVLLEAMACAKPVIATKVYGIPEMIENNYNGILIPPKDTSAIVEAIVSLIDEPTKRKELGEKALETVRKRFDQEKQLKELYALVNSTLDGTTKKATDSF